MIIKKKEEEKRQSTRARDIVKSTTHKTQQDSLLRNSINKYGYRQT